MDMRLMKNNKSQIDNLTEMDDPLRLEIARKLRPL